MNPISALTNYLKQQLPPAIRHTHITIMLLIISQIIISNFIEVHRDGTLGTEGIEFIATWAHFIIGFLLVPLTLMFVILEFKRHGFSYFYPYLSGKFTQIKEDIKQLIAFKLPDAAPHGIAAVVQGLGLGAVVLVVLSGLTWFIGWNSNAAWEHDIKELHELLTGLVEAYLIGHGLLGLLHVMLLKK